MPISPTTRAEQFLLLTSIVALPLQDHFDPVAGMSVMYLIFAALGTYIIVHRLHIVGKILCHPVFIVAYVFIGVTLLLEFTSPLSRYDELSRFGQMIGGAVCVAVLCRDRSALAAGLYGYIAAALWVAIVLYSTSYGTLQEVGTAEDFKEASKIRGQTFESKPLHANINGMAFVCAQGGIVAFALSLLGGLKHRRIPLLGIAVFCFIASFLPMSRGTTVVSLVALAIMLYSYGVRQGKTLILVSILGLGIYMLVPDAVWSRMAFSTETQDGKMEARARLYTTALDRLPEYVVAGVGAGNFFNKWAFEKGFSKQSHGVNVALAAHNSLVQITINWGVLGLLTFLWIIWCVYRSIPLRCGRDELSLALLGIIVSVGLLLLQQHNFYEKVFALGLGLLIGARQWIWPAGIVSAVEVGKLPVVHSN